MLESLAVQFVGRAHMLAGPTTIIVVMNIVVVVVGVAAQLGVTKIRWAMGALAVTAPAISATGHSGL